MTHRDHDIGQRKNPNSNPHGPLTGTPGWWWHPVMFLLRAHQEGLNAVSYVNNNGLSPAIFEPLYVQMWPVSSISSILWTHYLLYIFENTNFILWSSFWDTDIFHSVTGKWVLPYFLLLFCTFSLLLWHLQYTLLATQPKTRYICMCWQTSEWGSQKGLVQLAGRSCETVYWMCAYCIFMITLLSNFIHFELQPTMSLIHCVKGLLK